jgi:uncharacterized membrane protein YidH (DUF202 family)
MNARDADRGAARERTSLAWRRTALACVVNAALLLRAGDGWLQAAAFFGLAIATGLAAASALSFRDSQTRGYFAGRRFRAETLVLIVAAFSALDLIAITR